MSSTTADPNEIEIIIELIFIYYLIFYYDSIVDTQSKKLDSKGFSKK